MNQRIIFASRLEQELGEAIAACAPDRLFVLVDDTTRQLCWPLVSAFGCMSGAELVSILPGDTHKSLQAVSQVWEALQRGGATRHSLLVCIGGGMVTDLGGFAASTFKRGIAFVNVPTTLLAMVDASVGGKTGINFGGLKNEIGVFSDARTVIIDTAFLKTLDAANLRSGYAEMLKHSLIADEAMWAAHVSFPLDEPDLSQLQGLVAQSVSVKERIVTADPHEQGLRKALNLGHTFGHAIESLAFSAEATHLQPLLHGYAVAFGLVCELYLSVVKCGFPTERMRQTVRFIRENYGVLPITCDDYPELLRLMRHDKKNTAGVINFTLLSDIGQLQLNQTATDDEICEAFDFLREG